MLNQGFQESYHNNSFNRDQGYSMNRGINNPNNQGYIGNQQL